MIDHMMKSEKRRRREKRRVKMASKSVSLLHMCDFFVWLNYIPPSKIHERPQKGTIWKGNACLPIIFEGQTVHFRGRLELSLSDTDWDWWWSQPDMSPNTLKKTPRKKKDKAAKDGLKRMCFFLSGKSSRDVFGWSVSSENPNRSYEMKWLKRQNPFQIHAQVSSFGVCFGVQSYLQKYTKIRCPMKPSGYVGWLLRYSHIYSIPPVFGEIQPKRLFPKNPQAPDPMEGFEWTCMIRGV